MDLQDLVYLRMNLKQLFFEVKRSANGLASVIPVNKIGGGEMITPEELISEIKKSVKERE